MPKNNDKPSVVPAPAGRRSAMRIDEVAALAGVSIATVSRALANPGRVSARTRARVLEVVERTGYTPNVAGRSLRAARSQMVLVVVPNVITPFFSELFSSVDRALSAEGYSLLLGNRHDAPEKEGRLVAMVRSGQADGVILLDGKPPRSGRTSLVELGVPMVSVSVPAAATHVPAVLVDERGGGALAARHLLALGHDAFLYIAGPPGNHSDAGRWSGFHATLTAAGVQPRRIAHVQGDFYVESGVAAGRAYLAMRRRPTAVFAASDMMAIGFIRTMHDAGIRVPEDVSVVGFDGIAFADYCEPPLTTVRQPSEAMGREAVRLLVDLIRGAAIPQAELRPVLPVSLRVAASTARPTNHAAARADVAAE